MLTTLSAVKARLSIDDPDVSDDALLNSFIALMSARFENDCNRTFGYTLNVTEEFEGDETEIRCRCYPVDEAQPITFQFRASAADGWQVPANGPDYIVRRGCVISLTERIATWKQQATVTYSGGYKLPDATSPAQATTPLPDDLQYACIEQIAWLYQNKDRLGLQHVSGDKGSIAQLPKMDLLPHVAATIAKYERYVN